MVFFISFCLLNVATAFGQSDLKNNQGKELKQLRKDIKETKKNLTTKRNQEVQIKSSLTTVNAEIKNINDKLAALDQQILTKKQKTAALVLQSNYLEQEISKQRQDLRLQIYAYYLAAPNDLGKSLLVQDDLNSINRVSIYRKYLLKNRVKSFAALKTNTEDFKQTHRDISSETRQLQILQQAHLAEKQSLALQVTKQQMLLAQLGEEISSTEQRLAQLVEAQRRLEEIVATLPQKKSRPPAPVTEIKKSNSEKDFTALKGKLPLPLNGEIIERFGETKAFSGKKAQGMLIKATHGIEVKSIANGTIVFADNLPGFGQLVIIDHGEGYLSLYGHNQTLYKNKGSDVKAGDIIASLTTNGSNNDTALYFEMRKQGIPINPLQWCRIK